MSFLQASSVHCFSYASRATPQDFEIYAPHATFEDPLMQAQGYAFVFWLLQNKGYSLCDQNDIILESTTQIEGRNSMIITTTSGM